MRIYNPERTLHITEGTGKMEGISSLNTNSKTNPFCQSASLLPGTVCNKCYSNRMLSFRRTLSNALDKNSHILSTPQEIWLPPINAQVFRLHSFGELINYEHLQHFHAIIVQNPETTFSLWTKRLDLVRQYVSEFYKPHNLVLVYSVPIINPELSAPKCFELQIPEHFDHAYVVYDKDGEKQVEINCEEKCIECLRCYQSVSQWIIRARLK